MPIYTRTGDRGQTGLFSGERVSKANLRIEAIGTVDELNAIIGATIAQIQNSIRQLGGQNYNSKVKSELEKIQNDLFEIGAMLANPRQKVSLGLEKRVKMLEKLIDEMTKELPRLMNFVLPGGSKLGSSLHFARAVSRRAERRIVSLSKRKKISKEILIYINRLSDFLFTIARFVNFKEGKKETIWKRK